MYKLFFHMACIILLTSKLCSQGCSDAGFCTLDILKPHSTNSVQHFKNQFKIGGFIGGADYSIFIYGNYFEYNRQINSKISLDAKLTSLGQSGNSFSTLGIGDLFLNANYNATDKLKLTLGSKLPLSMANKSKEQLPLPMDYQSSLGTFDIVFGAGYSIDNFQIVAALQYPLTQNDNQFTSSLYPSNSKLSLFQSTKNFERSGDVLLRVSYPFLINQNFKITPSILPIYHLSNDKYQNEQNHKLEIIGSKGLTLNGNIYFDYEINHRNFLQLNFGMPFMVRDARPDGLTRSFIVTIEYRIKF